VPASVVERLAKKKAQRHKALVRLMETKDAARG
jgi:hypothetical protein